VKTIIEYHLEYDIIDLINSPRLMLIMLRPINYYLPTQLICKYGNQLPDSKKFSAHIFYGETMVQEEPETNMETGDQIWQLL